jgi:hypothetical protein
MKSRQRTQHTFAEELGITPQTFGKTYLRSTPLPGAEFFLRLIMLGINVEWLLTGVGRAPDPTDEEAIEWIRRCRAEADLREKEMEIKKLMVEAFQRSAERINDEKQKNDILAKNAILAKRKTTKKRKRK